MVTHGKPLGGDETRWTRVCTSERLDRTAVLAARADLSSAHFREEYCAMTDEKNELEQSVEATAPEQEEPVQEAEVEVVAEVETEVVAEAEPTVEVTEPVVETEVEQAPVEPEAKPDVHYSDSFKGLSRGDLVEGVVVHIDKDGVLVDVGQKSEGIIRPGELSAQRIDSPEEVVSVGDTVKVMVMESEDREGNIILSKKRADFEKAWDRVQESFEKGSVITAMVSDRVKGGLQVDLGIRGFVPGSHVGSGKVMNLDRFVGQSIPLKVIEIDRERRKVVLSHRLAVDEQRSKERETTMGSLAEGQIRDGVIRRITDYGAFVDLGGVDGLLHISEMSWTRITHPSDMVKVGQKTKVMILKLDPKSERISLGLRQILPDPWSEVEGRFNVGDVVTGQISRLVPFGAFVQLDGGVEGIIPNTELSHKRVKRPEDVVQVGETVEVKVLDIRAEERRMSLSLRALQARPEPEPVRHQEPTYQQSNSSGFSGKTTLADLIGDKLQNFVSSEKDEKPEKTRSKRSRKPVEPIEDHEDHEDLEMEMSEPMIEADVIHEMEPIVEPEVAEVEAAEPVVEAEASSEAEATPEAEKTEE